MLSYTWWNLDLYGNRVLLFSSEEKQPLDVLNICRNNYSQPVYHQWPQWNDRLRGTHYLDRPVTKWKYWRKMSIYIFPLIWALWKKTKKKKPCFCFSLRRINVCMWMGRKYLIAPVSRGEPCWKSGITHISIFISFSGTLRPLACFTPI